MAARLTRGRPLARSAAVLYSIAALLALLWLRHQPAWGRETILWILACRLGDRHRCLLHRLAGRRGESFAPSISPSKTWSGLVGGMCASAVISGRLRPAVPGGRYPPAGADRRLRSQSLRRRAIW